LLTYTLYGIFILACIVMIVSVLLQPGKADAGALFTSSVSSTAFGPRGTQTILAKITIGAAATFMIVALLLSMGVGGQGSLMEGKTKATPTPSPTASPEQQASPGASPASTTQGENGATNAPAGTPVAPAASPEANANSSNK
jgi:preprotein translocase subunit SecG